MAPINERRQVQVTVDGAGETKQRAFAAAFSEIQKQLVGDQEECLLQIVPLEVVPLALSRQQVVEKFLFFFFKRTRTTYTVRLKVTVTLNAVPFADLAFSEHAPALAGPWPRFVQRLKGVK